MRHNVLNVYAAIAILLIRSFVLTALAMSAPVWADDSAKPALDREPEAEPELDVDFASGPENERVSVSLANSELLVRLGKELRLHCEVSSRDDLDAAPELGIGLALRFRFQ